MSEQSFESLLSISPDFNKTTTLGIALSGFQNTIEQNKNYRSSLKTVAHLYLQNGKEKKALKTYKKAIEHNPNDTESHYQLAQIYLKTTSKEEQAEEHLKKCLVTNSDHKKARSKLSKLLLNSNKEEQAEDHLEQLVKSFPDNLKYILRLTNCYLGLNKIEKTKQLLNDSLKIFPHNLEIRMKLAQALLSSKNEDEDLHLAREQYKIILKMDPNNYIASMNLGIIYEKLKDFKNSILMYKRSINSGNENIECYYKLSNILLGNGRSEDSIKILKQILDKYITAIDGKERVKEKEPNEQKEGKENDGLVECSKICYKISKIYLQMSKNEDSIKYLNDSTKYNPNNFMSHYTLAKVYFKLKRFDQSLEEYSECIKIEPTNSKSYTGLGLIYLSKYENETENEKEKEKEIENINIYKKNNEKEKIKNNENKINNLSEALNNFNLSIKLDENNLKSYKGLVINYLKQKNFDLAIEILQKMLELNPFDSNNAQLIGLLLLNRNKNKNDLINSKKYFENALKLEDYKNEKIYFQIAFIQSKLNEIELSIKNYEKCLELNPNMVEANLNLGILLLKNYKMEKNVHKQIKYLENSINYLVFVAEKQPHNIKAQLNLAISYKKLGNFGQSQKRFQNIVNLKNFHTINKNENENQEKQEQEQEQEHKQEKEHGQDGEFAKLYQDIVWFNFGKLYERLGKKEMALNCYENSIKFNPNFAPSHNNLALLLVKNNNQNLSASFNSMRKTLELYPNNPKYYKTMAKILIYLNQYEEAKQCLEKIFNLKNLDKNNKNTKNYYEIAKSEIKKIDLQLEENRKQLERNLNFKNKELNKRSKLEGKYKHQEKNFRSLVDDKILKEKFDYIPKINFQRHIPQQYSMHSLFIWKSKSYILMKSDIFEGIKIAQINTKGEIFKPIEISNSWDWFLFTHFEYITKTILINNSLFIFIQSDTSNNQNNEKENKNENENNFFKIYKLDLDILKWDQEFNKETIKFDYEKADEEEYSDDDDDDEENYYDDDDDDDEKLKLTDLMITSIIYRQKDHLLFCFEQSGNHIVIDPNDKVASKLELDVKLPVYKNTCTIINNCIYILDPNRGLILYDDIGRISEFTLKKKDVKPRFTKQIVNSCFLFTVNDNLYFIQPPKALYQFDFQNLKWIKYSTMQLKLINNITYSKSTLFFINIERNFGFLPFTKIDVNKTRMIGNNFNQASIADEIFLTIALSDPLNNKVEGNEMAKIEGKLYYMDEKDQNKKILLNNAVNIIDKQDSDEVIISFIENKHPNLQLDVFINDMEIPQSPFKINLQPLKPCPKNFVIKNNPKLQSNQLLCQTGIEQPCFFTLSIRDKLKNIIDNPDLLDDSQIYCLIYGIDQKTKGLYIHPRIKYNGNGEYLFEFIVNVVGNYKVLIEFQEKALHFCPLIIKANNHDQRLRNLLSRQKNNKILKNILNSNIDRSEKSNESSGSGSSDNENNQSTEDYNEIIKENSNNEIEHNSDLDLNDNSVIRQSSDEK
ncbi:cellulose synthase operon protein c [Anaeramoeba flamelloides]|uniref:Cellulose synthase operon protein c n=1 Tax=Anaeramoeba flamelloides TaxID=1746091 RepID=A0ABQ8Y329_9EUKA|nr:cellulose synthase operon protein c [Anaeramoeba flamelloides]